MQKCSQRVQGGRRQGEREERVLITFSKSTNSLMWLPPFAPERFALRKARHLDQSHTQPLDTSQLVLNYRWPLGKKGKRNISLSLNGTKSVFLNCWVYMHNWIPDHFYLPFLHLHFICFLHTVWEKHLKLLWLPIKTIINT